MQVGECVVVALGAVVYVASLSVTVVMVEFGFALPVGAALHCGYALSPVARQSLLAGARLPSHTITLT